MARSPDDPTEREQRLDEILGGYLTAAAAGRGPDRRELIAAHPELASELAWIPTGPDPANKSACLPARQPLESGHLLYRLGYSKTRTIGLSSKGSAVLAPHGAWLSWAGIPPDLGGLLPSIIASMDVSESG